MLLRDELGMFAIDQEFAGLFPPRGQPAVSPSRLFFITIMQFMEGLTDRQAADAVRSRIDWKYALGLPLTDAGFDFSVLSEFRARLLQEEQAQACLTRLLTVCSPSAKRVAGLKRVDDSEPTPRIFSPPSGCSIVWNVSARRGGMLSMRSPLRRRSGSQGGSQASGMSAIAPASPTFSFLRALPSDSRTASRSAVMASTSSKQSPSHRRRPGCVTSLPWWRYARSGHNNSCQIHRPPVAYAGDQRRRFLLPLN